ncbi:hypothetical protein KUTeg_010241 [Tegillarca granosa]|uniref:Major facilitator superfamily (MFS) profile domain-containing protein n=1 Tax=Tegillarca granosa TaxID=220873 RepID=A0ABQ9FB50_TEGGR|nr:hypothetical protein KUTeg_010241 [Tegillarca granosa]
MSAYTPPFDDTVQLDDMPVDFSDTSPIVDPGEEDENKQGSSVQTVVVTAEDADDISKTRSIFTVLILLCINLLNYMDRYTIAGVLKDIQAYFNLNNSQAGLIQTVFILTYMVFSPIFGYLGDRWIRKYIMAGGIFFWSTVTLAGSFIPSNSFFAFAILRALVGVGEASYSTIAPTVIADLFVGDMRTRMLMIFYFAIPVGSGLGYIIGSNVAKAFHDWKFALRITPGLGVVCVILIVAFVKEPKRGMSEGGTNLHPTSLKADLIWLFKNKSFMLSTFGFTCVAFVTGALALWAPLFMLVLIFLGETCLCLNWSIVADILLYTVIPTRRATAESVQILMSHALGDATSPFIIGLYALYMTPFICVIGGGFFLATALFIEKDKDAAAKTTKDMISVDWGVDNIGFDSTVTIDGPNKAQPM